MNAASEETLRDKCGRLHCAASEVCDAIWLVERQAKGVHAMFVVLLKRRDGWFSSASRIRHARFLSSASALANSRRGCVLNKNVQALTFSSLE